MTFDLTMVNIDDMKEKEKANILFSIESPADIKTLSVSEMEQLADELRKYIIDVVSETGGHLAPSLGTVEMTIALCHVFNLPDDKIIWDVGHQAYPYKVLTGRRDKLDTIRTYGGMSGFLKRSESKYDVVGAGHASTSISSALGISVAESLRELNNHTIAIIGDGALTGGLAWEGMNNAGNLKKQLLVILNDNEMSISKNVGSIPDYLHRIVTTPFYNKIREDLWGLTHNKRRLRRKLRRIKETLKTLFSRNIMFDELGLRYIGPVDGHDISDLIRTFKRVKKLHQPILLHVLTKKGKGYSCAEKDPTSYHGIAGNGKKTKSAEKQIAYMNVFGKTAMELAEKHDDVVAITAAMTDGTGLCEFREKFKNRFFDVGIAEGHAVTFSSGLCIGGYRPIVAIYSSFLQRAVDNIMHDIVLQKLPVIFCIDRAGLVGKDGPTHHGVFDFAFLSMLPDVVVCAPKDGDELRSLMHQAYNITDKPVFIRYPRGKTSAYSPENNITAIATGSWECLARGGSYALIAIGTMVKLAMEIKDLLAKENVKVSVYNARFLKPYDEKMLDGILAEHSHVFSLEEACPSGGLKDTILNHMHNGDTDPEFHGFTLPDRFITHGEVPELMYEIGMTADQLTKKILEMTK